MNRNSKWMLALASTIICLPISATAENITTENEMVVTAGRLPLPTKEVASSFTIITSDEIKTYQYQTIVDALKSSPGLTVAQSGSTGTLTSIFARGASSNQTLVLLNGMAINDPSSPGGAANLANIPLDNVERIEIIRGPQSALYGSQALGGVVNIITKTGSRTPVTTMKVEAGTLATLNTSASTGGHVAGTDYFFSVSRAATRGSDTTPSRLRGNLGEEKDGNEVYSVSGSLGHDLTENLQASGFIQYTQANTEFDADGATTGFVNTYQNPDSKIRSKRLLTNLTFDGRFFDDIWKPSLRFSYARQTAHTTDAPDAGGSAYAEDDTYTGKKFDAAFDNIIKASENNLLAVGSSITYEGYESHGFRDFTGGYLILPNTNVDTHALAFYGSDHVTMGDNFFVTVSGRYDKPKGITGRFSYTIAPGAYFAESDTRLTASYGTGYKAPSLQQRFGYDPDSFGGYFIGNPNLKPETSRGWELGFEQGLFFADARIGATYFQSTVNDAIAVVYDIFFNSTAVNVDEFKTKGVEAFFETTPLENITTRVDYTFTVLNADVFASTLTRRPRHQLGVTAQWTPREGTRLAAAYQWTDPYRDLPRDAFGFYINPAPYSVVNLSASQALGHGLTLSGRINNLFDQTYEPVNGFEAPGIEALAAIAVTF